MHKWLHVALFAVWVAAFGIGGTSVHAETARPNIILVMPDDLGYGDYSCLGNPIKKTPNADAFWKQSVRFTDFHVSPTCSPTRSSLMSGRHEFKNGVTHTILERERMSLKTITLAQVLKSAGYTTGIFGKWHLGDEARTSPTKRGFDEVYIHGGGGIGQTYPGSCGDAPGNLYTNPHCSTTAGSRRRRGTAPTFFMPRRSGGWMASGKGIEPFFSYIALNVAHEPLQCPEENFQHYDGKVPEKVAKFYGMIETYDRNFGVLLASSRSGESRTTRWSFSSAPTTAATAGVQDLQRRHARAARGRPTRAARGPRVSGVAGEVARGAATCPCSRRTSISSRRWRRSSACHLTGDLAKQVEGRSLCRCC